MQMDTRARAALPAVYQRSANRLAAADASLRALNPSAVLDRGYAVVRGARGIIKRAADACAGENVRIAYSDGELGAAINAVLPRGEQNGE